MGREARHFVLQQLSAPAALSCTQEQQQWYFARSSGEVFKSLSMNTTMVLLSHTPWPAGAGGAAFPV